MNKSLSLFALFTLVFYMSVAPGLSPAQDNGLYSAGSEVRVPPKYSGASPTVTAPLSRLYKAAGPVSRSPVQPATPKAWALATTALLNEVNKERHDMLGGGELTRKHIQGAQNLLAKWWNVHDRQDLLNALSWVENEGHRKDFIVAGNFVASLDDENYQKLVDKLQQARDYEGLNKVRILRENFKRLAVKNLLGWDYVRYIALCRWGYAARYMSEDEAWERIMPAAAILQKNFESWEDLSENYIIGRAYWSYDETNKTGEKFLYFQKKLLSEPDSPWRLNQWDMNLQGGNLVSR